MNHDISLFLREWPHDLGKNVRKIVGEDGAPKLQVRLPLGIEQYELAGRPDGQTPGGAESYLELFEQRLEEHVAANGGADEFALSEEDCARLREESMLYYSRYLLCFQVGEYDQVREDTERNMRAFRFVSDYAERQEDRDALNQYWPYIIRINAMSRAITAAQTADAQAAMGIIERALQDIQALPEVATQTFSLEKMRSIGALEEMVTELRDNTPPKEAEMVRERLRKAIAIENYEKAAQLRDLLRSMGE